MLFGLLVINSDRLVSHIIMDTHKTDKKTRIIEAAMTVFSQHGLEKGKIADVAKKAGIGKGTVYEYFRSKEDIFNAIEQSIFDQFKLFLNEILSSPLSPTKKLKQLMDQGLNMCMEKSDTNTIMKEIWAQSCRSKHPRNINQDLVRYYDEFQDGIKTILQVGIDIGEFRKMNKDGVASLLMAFMDGLALQFTVMKDTEKFIKVKGEAIESFMRGIQK